MKKVLFFVTVLIYYATFSFGQSGIITTIAGNGTTGFSGDGGVAAAAAFRNPTCIALNPIGELYISDGNHRIRKVTIAGIVETVAGNGVNTHSGDGGPATASEISDVQGIAFDAIGNLYFAESPYIRKVDIMGIITTIAGTPDGLYNGDGIPAASAGFTVGAGGFARDAGGNFFISDEANFRIRKIDAVGTISTIAGTGGYGFSGDGGPATAAQIYHCVALCIDGVGNVYFYDYENNRIRKIATSGIISTFAGNGVSGFSGDGGVATAASIASIEGLHADALGNIYICDEVNFRLRQVNASGIINTLTGNGICGYTGDGGTAMLAEVCTPRAVITDASGNIYISDSYNGVIRMITAPDLNLSSVIDEFPKIFPNPATDKITIEYENGALVSIQDMVGKIVFSSTISSEKQTFDISNIANGVYIARVTNPIAGQNKVVRLVKNNHL